ncbi:MAG TPA: hypothetical protein VLN59_04935, partial [Burkholderiales bacterium]|nr:hypothetical protein [Burkholderiales bacterium]
LLTPRKSNERASTAAPCGETGALLPRCRPRRNRERAKLLVPKRWATVWKPVRKRVILET